MSPPHPRNRHLAHPAKARTCPMAYLDAVLGNALDTASPTSGVPERCMDDSRSDDLPTLSANRPPWRDWQWLLLLLVLVIPLRGWLLFNTEVAARDSIGFIRYALR